MPGEGPPHVRSTTVLHAPPTSSLPISTQLSTLAPKSKEPLAPPPPPHSAQWPATLYSCHPCVSSLDALSSTVSFMACW